MVVCDLNKLISLSNYFAVLVFSVLLLLMSSFTVKAQTAEQAWNSLLTENFRERPEFAFVDNNPKLPNVLIYGDSISIHFTSTVREQLQDKANVYRFYRNGGDSKSFIPKMTKMHQTMQNKKLADGWDFKWDVIHFNVGLHDLKYTHNKKLDKVNGLQVTSLNGYKKNLQTNILYLKKLAPSAKLIFAMTTPIPEEEPG